MKNSENDYYNKNDFIKINAGNDNINNEAKNSVDHVANNGVDNVANDLVNVTDNNCFWKNTEGTGLSPMENFVKKGPSPMKKLWNGVEVPQLGYGSFMATEGRGKDAIKEALECGYRYIDTAYFYFNEDQIGEAIMEAGIDRRELFLCSKVWPTMMGYEGTFDSFEKSCASLKTDYLDLYLIHWPKRSRKDENWREYLKDTWRAMEKLYEDGRVRAIGVSNFLPHHLEVILENARIKPMVDQLELHVGYMQNYATEYCKKQGIAVQAWSPLGRGRVLNDDRVLQMAEKYGKTPAQFLIAFLLNRDYIVIPKASVKERMLENMDVFDCRISEEDISYLMCIPEMGFSGEHPDLVEW